MASLPGAALERDETQDAAVAVTASLAVVPEPAAAPLVPGVGLALDVRRNAPARESGVVVVPGIAAVVVWFQPGVVSAPAADAPPAAQQELDARLSAVAPAKLQDGLADSLPDSLRDESGQPSPVGLVWRRLLPWDAVAVVQPDAIVVVRCDSMADAAQNLDLLRHVQAVVRLAHETT